jgi:CPA2 family monovalent cation:H+ antiporter-2
LPPLSGLLQGEVAGPGLNLGALAATVGLTLGKVAAFIALMLIVGRRVIPAILHYIAHTGSRELFRLAVLSVALGVAFIAAELFGVSFALGAFFAGVVLSESQLSQRAAEESLPFRDAFAVLFFVSVGMLFNPMVLMREPVALLGAISVIALGATTAMVVVRLRGYPLETALLVGAGLAQIGEFSFILADLGIGIGVLPVSARDLILGTSILTILANPLLFAALERLKPWLERHGPAATMPPPPEALIVTDLADHAVLVGYGRVGHVVGAGLKQQGWPFLVIEDGAEAIEKLRAEGIAANLSGARILLVAIPNAFEACQIIKHARATNPNLEIVARAHFDAEVDSLMSYGANTVVMGEREIARSMLEHTRTVPVPEPPAN